jgi:phosphatidylserine decarboxylase
MPSSARPMVALGTRAIAGETVLADFNATAAALTFKTG